MRLVILAFIALLLSFTSYGLAPITGPTTVCVGLTSTLANSSSGGTWTSSNPSIATVGITSGVYTGIAAGTATISYKLGITIVTSVITVNPLPSAIIGMDSICTGNTTTLSNAIRGGTWSSSATSVATITAPNGVLTAVGGGYVNITYTLPTGCYATKRLKVNFTPTPILTGVGFVYTGTTLTLSDVTLGGKWTSGNVSLATIGTSGIATGISTGILHVSYTLPSGCYVIGSIEVNPLPRSADLDAWYPFCGDTTDHSGNGNDLLNHVNAPALLNTDRPPLSNPNSAYEFGGLAGPSTKMQRNVPFPLGGSGGDFTYSCWIRPTIPQNSIIMYNGDPTANGWGFVMNNNAFGVAGQYACVQFWSPAIGMATLPVSYKLPTLSCWYQLILEKQGPTYSFYVGRGGPCVVPSPPVFVGAFVSPLYPFPGAADLFMIGNDNYLGMPFLGTIDDIAIYHEALTPAERYALWSFNPDAAPFTLGPDVTICTDSITLAPMPQETTLGYLWSNGNTIDSAITIFPSASASGTDVWLKINKPFGCIMRDTITVYKAPIPVNLGPNINFCAGDTITLNCGFPGSKWVWNTGDTTNSIKVGSTGYYSVTVDSGVCVGRDTVYAHMSRVPIVDLGPDTTNCSGKPILVKPSVIDPGYTYQWSNFFTTPTQTFTAPGSFTLTATDSGCSRSDDINVYIVFDTLHFYPPRDTFICMGQYVATNVQGDLHITYQWTPTAGVSASTTHNPDIRPDTSALYIMTARYTGCPDINDSIFIHVEPVPYVYLGGNKSVCQSDTMHITPQVTPGWYTHYHYAWSPGPTTKTLFDDTTLYTVVLTSADTFGANIMLTVTTDSAGCKGVDSALVVMYPSHIDSVLTSNFELCPGDSVQFNPIPYTGLASIAQTHRWTPGTYLSDSLADRPWVHPITSTDYRMIGITSHGCRDSFYVHVRVHPSGTIYLGDSVTLHPGDSFQISPTTNCSYFSWSPPLGLSSDKVSNPIAKPDVNTMYIVKATTEFGCVVTDSINIRVDPETLLNMPNAFVPGGVNKTFNVVKDGIADLIYFQIYDQWGVKVFETRNINQGWDGTFNGKPQPFAVYVYEIKALTSNGTVFKQQGNVTLIR